MTGTKRKARRAERLTAVRMDEILPAWEAALAEDAARTRKAKWLRSPHPFHPRRHQRMAGK